MIPLDNETFISPGPGMVCFLLKVPFFGGIGGLIDWGILCLEPKTLRP